MKNNFKYVIVLAISLGLFSACSEEDLDPTLAQSKNIETSVKTVGDLQAVLVGAYERLSATEAYGRDFIILGEIFSDNTTSNSNSNRFTQESQMDLTPTSAISSDLWAQFYGVIASANIIITAEGISGDADQINQIKGQAYALRALSHYNLLLFYGQQNVQTGGLGAQGVPYVTQFRDNSSLYPSRNTVQEVRDFAYADLDMALSIMTEALNDNSKQTITTYAVDAISARISNYFGDWARSLASSKAVIDSNQYTIVGKNDFLNSFKIDAAANSVFEIAFSATDNPDINGLANIYQAGSYGDVEALPNLAAIYEEGDIRGASAYSPSSGEDPLTVIGLDAGTFRNVGKYPSTAPYEDNVSVIRYEEVVLLYAEALLETGNAPLALTTLNSIPAKRGASAYSAATKSNILLERRKELAFEGFRFHDLARTGQDIPDEGSAVVNPHGLVEYGSFNFALPLPSNEVDVNANIDQNFGFL